MAHKTRLWKAPEEITLRRARGDRFSTPEDGRDVYADGRMRVKEAPTESNGKDSLYTDIVSMMKYGEKIRAYMAAVMACPASWMT